MKVIEFNKIGLTLNGNRILDDISFDIKKGEIFGLVGHNGAGKTSLLRILLGMIVQYDGNVKRIWTDSSHGNNSKPLVGAILDSMSIDVSLTAPKYISNISIMNYGVTKEKQEQVLEKVGLLDTGKKRISQFSLGMRRRLLIAGALVASPEILVMDEPFNGIDPQGMADIRLLIHQLSADGMTVLVTSHNIPELIKLSTRFGVLCKGKLIDNISSQQLEETHISKTVFRTNAPKILLERIKQHYPALCCYANVAGEISVPGVQKDFKQSVFLDMPECGIVEVFNSDMSEEEKLLWRMDGYTP